MWGFLPSPPHLYQVVVYDFASVQDNKIAVGLKWITFLLQLLSQSPHSLLQTADWYLPGRVGAFLMCQNMFSCQQILLIWREILLHNLTFPLSSVASTQFVRDILSHTCLSCEKTEKASTLELNSSFQYRNAACLHQETMTSAKQRLTQLTRVLLLLITRSKVSETNVWVSEG